MSTEYDEDLAAVVAVEMERAHYEREHGSFASYNDWPRDLLVRWRTALAQLRLDRTLIRKRGSEPPALSPELAWVDERWFELKFTDDGDPFWVQTPEQS